MIIGTIIFEYRTMYQMYYKNQHIGGVRIGRIGQTEDRPDIPDEFETLPTDYFSLGVSLEYYKNLKREGIPRVEILIALHDIAYDLKLLETVREERVYSAFSYERLFILCSQRTVS